MGTRCVPVPHPCSRPLSPLPSCRATAKDVLAHPWVCGNAPSTAIDVNNLKKLQATRKLRKAGAKLMALNRIKNLSLGPAK